MSATASKPQPDPGTKALLASLESVVMDLNDMENMIENFDESAAESFYAKVNEYIVNLKEVENRAPGCPLQVPRGALERIDHDSEQNPELFAQELLTRCKDESGQLNARVLGIKKVRQTVTEGWRDSRSGGGAEGNAANGIRSASGGGPESAGGVSGGVDEIEAVAAQSQGIHGGVLPKGLGGKATPGYSSSSNA
eukprot:g9620.t1